MITICPRCVCGKPMGRRAQYCRICREAAKNLRRKYAHREPEHESAEDVDRKLAIVDALKRKQRWAA